MTTTLVDEARTVAKALGWHPTAQPCECWNCRATRALTASADEIEQLRARVNLRYGPDPAGIETCIDWRLTAEMRLAEIERLREAMIAIRDGTNVKAWKYPQEYVTEILGTVDEPAARLATTLCHHCALSREDCQKCMVSGAGPCCSKCNHGQVKRS